MVVMNEVKGEEIYVISEKINDCPGYLPPISESYVKENMQRMQGMYKDARQNTKN